MTCGPIFILLYFQPVRQFFFTLFGTTSAKIVGMKTSQNIIVLLAVLSSFLFVQCSDRSMLENEAVENEADTNEATQIFEETFEASDSSTSDSATSTNTETASSSSSSAPSTSTDSGETTEASEEVEEETPEASVSPSSHGISFPDITMGSSQEPQYQNDGPEYVTIHPPTEPVEKYEAPPMPIYINTGIPPNLHSPVDDQDDDEDDEEDDN